MSADARNLLLPLNFCVIDLETTGGNLKYDKIIEIGLVKIKGLQVAETKEILINPEIPIPQFVQKLTSISEDDIKTAPIIEDVIDEIQKFIGDDILVAHNTSFDIPFLNSVLRRLKKPLLKNKILCTNVMTKYLIPEMMNSNLPHLCHIFKIPHERAHRALSDAHSTAKLLLEYLEIFIEKGIKKVNQLYYPRNKFELDHIHLNKKDDNSKILEKVINSGHSFTLAFKGKEGVLIDFLPYSSQVTDLKELKTYLDADWEKLTIKILGHFFQGLVQFKDYFLNIPKENRERTYQYLHKKFSTDAETPPWDLIISPHLVHDQYVIFSKNNLSYKSTLIFKYPGHEKKLEQYIKSQINKSKRKRLPNHSDLAPIDDLISHYAAKNPHNLACLAKKEIPLHNTRYFEDFIKEVFNFETENYFPEFHF